MIRTNPFRHLVFVAIMWLVGLAAGIVLLFLIGPQGQCASDPECAAQADRWWHTAILILVGIGPGVVATVLWLRSDDAAV